MRKNRMETLNKGLMEKEIQKILAIDQEITEDMGVLFTDKKWSDKEFLMELEGKWIYSQVAYINGKLVGYLISSEKYRRVKIHRIAVMQNYRGKGIGIEMYKSLLKKAVDNGMNRVWLEVHILNHQAIRLYEKIGFVKSDAVMKDDCYLYWKKIGKGVK